MKNTIVSYANLNGDLKMAFLDWLETKTRDLISFPFQGKHMKGYIFNHDQNNYLVITELQINNATNTSLEDIEQIDIEEEI